MALDDSILKSTKKNLGLDENYDAFDHDVMTQINSAFFTLYQLGVGPADGFTITGDEQKWSAFTGEEVSKIALAAVEDYVYLKCRLKFDPPGLAHHINAIKEQITELEHRLLTEMEVNRWIPSTTSPSLP